MTGPPILGAAGVVKNLHAILLARFQAPDKLRWAKNGVGTDNQRATPAMTVKRLKGLHCYEADLS
jgi:hypothetical protein